jgi:hypothetical protein
VLICLLIAKSLLRLDSIILLKKSNQKTIVIISIKASNLISFLETERISPIIKFENLSRFPLIESKTIPNAIPAEENTPIIVSEDDFSLSVTYDIPRAKTIENIKTEKLELENPKTAPSEAPVRAQCPIASEKKAILLCTIIVPTSAKAGEINNIAKRAFFMKLYSIHENGKIISKTLYILIIWCSCLNSKIGYIGYNYISVCY